MEPATEHETTHVESLLGAYRELQSQFDRVRERLRRAEENRHTVARRIYDRVRADYDRELDAIRARLTPLRDELDRVHESLEARCHDAMSALSAVEEELAETTFRHRIGEYPDPTYDGLRGALDARAADARARQASLEEALAAIASLRSPAEPDAAPSPTPDVPAHALDTPAPVSADAAETHADTASKLEADGNAEHATDDLSAIVVDEPPRLDRIEHEAPARAGAMFDTPRELDPDPSPVATSPPDNAGAESPAPRATAVAEQNFENPQQWARDVSSDTPRGERRVRLSAPAVHAAPVRKTVSDEIDSVLAPLDAPAPAPAKPERTLHAPTSVAPAPASLPSLVFVSGPHAGQAIALLPTTLTIGREHDNNVEIKDADVARYHARILRERDDFVVEDLNSSTGTWVNGERKAKAVLTHGDVIRVGQTELALDFEWTTDSR